MKLYSLIVGAVMSLIAIPQASPSYSTCNSTGHVGEIRWISNSQFNFIMYDLPGHGSQVMTVKSSNSNIGAEGIKMMLSILQNALATGKEVWAGSRDGSSTTSGCQETWDILTLTIYQN